MSSIRVGDRYVLDREIGRGGSGAVWLARDEVLGRTVALKLIGIPPGASAHDLARAEREARLAARVNHPNVISVFDFVNDGDQHWLVTEFVDGTTLARMIQERGRLSPDEAAPLLLQAAEALAAAHRMDVVHRDVKPSNILIGRDGSVRLSDFGIARGLADASLTQTGLVTGSPAYLAPEVATGASATPASDVWSFGTTIFHALAGRPPYEVAGDGNAVLATLYRIAHEPPPRMSDAGWLAPLLEATMEQDPNRRPPMDQVVAYLRSGPQARPELTTQVLPTVPPPEVTRARAPIGSRLVLAGLAALAVLAVIGVALVLSNGDDDPGGAGADNSARTTDNSTSDETSDETSEPPPPSVAELESFATSYVETAVDDPNAGFAMLTADYQARSPDYLDFWGSVEKPKISDVTADPSALTVTYTYRYEFNYEDEKGKPKKEKREETVTLHLVQDGDALLIDDAVSSG